MAAWVRGAGLALVVIGFGTTGCGSDQSQEKALNQAAVLEGVKVDDRSRCDFEGRTDRDVRETASPGAVIPNVRRVYGVIGTGDDRRRVLLCREVDTNLDGMKDVVRTYNDDGEKISEAEDSNYDGKIDTWRTFANDRIQKIERDRDGSGTVDETRYYIGGELARVQRDTNGDGKPDIFEIYEEGTLMRMGVDGDFDGRVDRWHRDELRAREEAEKEAEAEAQKEGASGEGEPSEDDQEEVPASAEGAPS